MYPIILSIDGNIGSGKSSIVKYLKKNFETFCNNNSNNKNNKICFLEEPVEIWESIKDISSNETIIEKFYKNSKKYSFAFQMMAYISRLSILKKELNKDYDFIITERSIYTDRNIFAKMLYFEKEINDIEWQVYNLWFDEFSSIAKNIKIVYIRTIPEICDKRIKVRNRKGENISVEYLKNCNYYHDSWLNNPQLIEEGKVLVINGNEETNTSLFIKNNYFDNIMDKIYKFMKNN